VEEYRVVQYADGLIEVFITMQRALSESERGELQSMLCNVFGAQLQGIVTQVDSIDWRHGRKQIDVMRLDYLRRQGAPPGSTAAATALSQIAIHASPLPQRLIPVS
jgi:hypothetical protein